MTRDEAVFVLGEEVAQYNGAYKVSSPYVIAELDSSSFKMIPAGHQGTA